VQPATDRDQSYWPVEYLQFRDGGALKTVQAIIGILTWPLVWPLAMLSKRSAILFRSASELLSFVPYFPGVILRYEFYRFALRRCGRNVLFEFGAIFIESDVEVGDNVLIGRYNVVHHCDFGDDVLVGERCTFLSGSRQHAYDRLDIPMTQQGGAKKRIRIGSDCWIGSHSVVMEDVGDGCIVGAGSVVSRPLSGLSIAVGSPATVVRRRGDPGDPA
jgi:acetyltransferase-like isoleucine patch superfamily enzyme